MHCKDFHGYTVYEDGRIYSTKTDKFLKFDCYSDYAKVTLRIDKKPVRFSVHRLIAYLFCNPPPNRWNDDEFRNKTAKNISAGQIASGCFSGKKNPRYRFEIRDVEGNEYMMTDLIKLTGKSLTWVYNHIIKFLNGEDVKEFAARGIVSVTDLKSKVNRLSKA